MLSKVSKVQAGSTPPSQRITSGFLRNQELPYLNPSSISLRTNGTRRAEATRRASTNVVGPRRCEPRSRWPSFVDEHHESLATSDAGVKQISVQHGVMLGQHRNNHRRIFGALAFVDGGGVRGNKGVEFAEPVRH